MSTIKIKTNIYYWTGQWGSNVPVEGATVQIIDVDAPGKGDDLIFTGTTDANGHVEGMSGEWQDSSTIQVPVTEYKDVNVFGKHHQVASGVHMESKTIADPTDVSMLIIKISKEGHEVSLPFPYVNDDAPAIPVIISDGAGFPPPVRKVLKDERALIVVSYLVGPGEKKWEKLYEFLNESGVDVAKGTLDSVYRSIDTLINADATWDAFISTINKLASNKKVKVIDVILDLHGGPGCVVFFDNKSINAATVKTDLGKVANGKLRMLYSTACYGESLNNTFLEAGFKVCAGAKLVNANSPGEYPVVLKSWADGIKFADAIQLGDNPAEQHVFDKIATKKDFPDVDSTKVVAGNLDINISTAV